MNLPQGYSNFITVPYEQYYKTNKKLKKKKIKSILLIISLIVGIAVGLSSLFKDIFNKEKKEIHLNVDTEDELIYNLNKCDNITEFEIYFNNTNFYLVNDSTYGTKKNKIRTITYKKDSLKKIILVIVKIENKTKKPIFKTLISEK